MAKETKIQYRGHCPCCGNQQAVLRNGQGHMSKHGYTVKFGWFEGVCPGQNYQPMEINRTQTDKIILQVRTEVQSLRQRVQKLEEGTYDTTALLIPKVPFMPKPELIPFAEANIYAQNTALEVLKTKFHYRAKQGEAFADYLEVTLNAVYGKALIKVEKK